MSVGLNLRRQHEALSIGHLVIRGKERTPTGSSFDNGKKDSQSPGGFQGEDYSEKSTILRRLDAPYSFFKNLSACLLALKRSIGQSTSIQ